MYGSPPWLEAERLVSVFTQCAVACGLLRRRCRRMCLLCAERQGGKGRERTLSFSKLFIDPRRVVLTSPRPVFAPRLAPSMAGQDRPAGSPGAELAARTGRQCEGPTAHRNTIIEYEASPGGGPHANAAGQSATGAPKPGPPRCTVPSRPAAPARTVSVDTLRDSGHSQRPHTDARTCVLCADPHFPAPTAGVAYGPQDVYGYRCARPPPASWFSIHLAHRCIGIRTSMVHQHCADGSAA